MFNLGFIAGHFIAGFINSSGEAMTTQAKAQAITVIGGADGPTAIFLASSNTNTLAFIGAVVVIAALAVGVVSLLTYRKKKYLKSK